MAEHLSVGGLGYGRQSRGMQVLPSTQSEITKVRLDIRTGLPSTQSHKRMSWAYLRSKRRLGRKYAQAILFAFLACLVVWQGILETLLSGEPEVVEDRRLAEPPDAFSSDARRKGAVVLHCIGLFYMFVAIAIVCDECFVPALEVITEVLQLSPDVAGATFMAAGGSAPEFFTSLIGTCVGAQSDIGTGTIIGSAVFNVLFVIGACAIAAPEPLKLTWFPLARDSLFYAVGLIAVTIVFLDEQVKWWEAMLLFFLYLLYTTFMFCNERIQQWATGRPEEGEANINLEGEQQKTDCASEFDTKWATNSKARTGSKGSNQLQVEAAQFDTGSVTPNESAGTGEDGGSRQVSLEAHQPYSSFTSSSVLSGGSARSSGSSLTLGRAGADDNSTDRKKFRHLSARVKTHAKQVVALGKVVRKFQPTVDQDEEAEALSNAVQEATFDRDGDVDTHVDSTGGSDSSSSKRCVEDIQEKKPSKPAVPAGNPVAVTHAIPGDTTPSLIPNLVGVVPDQDRGKDKDGDLNRLETNASCIAKAGDEEEDEENEPLSAWPPDMDASKKDWIWYLLTLPIVLCLVCTIPDVRRPGCRRLYVITFFMSIVWIAGFTWVMVWLATVIAETCGLDEHIMGLTVLAAGTSVPDLLTSMIVAREGHGDMAVSSSIGSNIFDITVGLPVPWMLYCAMNHGSVFIKSEALEICVMLLLGMLGFTIGTVVCHGWVMTRGMGASLLLLYLCFEVVAVGITFAPSGSLKLIHV